MVEVRGVASLGSGDLFHFEIFDGGLDSILSQHGAVKLDGWELEVLGDVLVLDVDGILDVHTLEELGRVRAASNSGTASKRLENSFLNLSIIIDLDLEFHDITTSGSANESSTDILILLIERANISWVLIMVDNSLVISEVTYGHCAHQVRVL